jgi:hypothetical protein
VSLFHNAKALLNFINRKKKNISIVVSINSLLLQKLNAYFNFSGYFLSEFDLSLSTKEEIIESIRMRHSATHKILMDKEGERISKQQLRQISARIHRDAKGNLGNALLRWTFGTKNIKDREVEFNYDYDSIPNMITDENYIILELLLLYKSLSRPQIHEMIGNEVSTDYANTIESLVNHQIIEEKESGELMLNSVLINEIHDDFLKYRRVYSHFKTLS